jgi:hypothetical protein
MAFILRQRAEPLPDDEARLERARAYIAGLDAALLRAVDRDGPLDDIAAQRLAWLADRASECRTELDEAEWRFRKGDTLGANDHLQVALVSAEEGIRQLEG